jgi:hypothetical protein
MNDQSSRAQVVARRAELLAELLFQELGATLIARVTDPDVGYDLLVSFPNEKKGINTFAIEIKASERPVADSFPLDRATYHRLAHSNIPAMLLVVDVKRNHLYYAWLRADADLAGRAAVSVPVAEITDATKPALRAQLQRATGLVAAAG